MRLKVKNMKSGLKLHINVLLPEAVLEFVQSQIWANLKQCAKIKKLRPIFIQTSDSSGMTLTSWHDTFKPINDSLFMTVG